MVFTYCHKMQRPKTEFQTVQELENVIEELDIVEFNRKTYSHFALHIEDGICVHVLGPGKGESKGMKSAQYLRERADGDMCRVNNGIITAKLLKVNPRSRKDCLAKSYAGLETDGSGRVIVGAETSVKYDVVSDNNCEGYATYWKYEHENGWSSQALQGVGYLSDTLRRTAEVSMEGYRKLYDDAPTHVKPFVAVAAAPVEIIRVTAKATTATANVVTGVFRSVAEISFRRLGF